MKELERRLVELLVSQQKKLFSYSAGSRSYDARTGRKDAARGRVRGSTACSGGGSRELTTGGLVHFVPVGA